MQVLLVERDRKDLINRLSSTVSPRVKLLYLYSFYDKLFRSQSPRLIESYLPEQIEIPFSDFKPTFRGYTLSDKPALKSKNIEQLGFLIADKQFGKFELNIDWVKFY